MKALIKFYALFRVFLIPTKLGISKDVEGTFLIKSFSGFNFKGSDSQQ